MSVVNAQMVQRLATPKGQDVRCFYLARLPKQRPKSVLQRRREDLPPASVRDMGRSSLGLFAGFFRFRERVQDHSTPRVEGVFKPP